MAGYRLRELKIEVNRNCPLYCLHCSSNGMPKAHEYLDPHEVSELIKEFSYLGGEKLCISGGEPLCYDELSAIINSCQGISIDVSLYTTGIVRNGGPLKPISERTAAFLADRGVKVIFSLHGANSKTHDLLTQVKGSFDTTVNAIERVKDARVTAEIHVVPMATNFNELIDIAKLAGSLGIDKISWLRFVPQGRGWLNKNSLKLGSEQVTSLADTKTELQRICPDITIRMGAPFNILCSQEPTPCEAGVSELTIGPDGRVSPCDAFKQSRVQDDFGNILEHSLAEIWRKSYFLKAVRDLHKSRLDSSCDSCSLHSNCNSGCLAQKAIATGMLTDGQDPDCPLSNAEVVEDEVEAITLR